MYKRQVLLIGTHKDLVSDDELSQAQMRIGTFLKSMTLAQQVVQNIRQPPRDGWFFAVDNKSRTPVIGGASDSTIGDIREALKNATMEDTRKVRGLDGNETLYVHFKVPSSALLLLDVMRSRGKFGDSCKVPVCRFHQVVKTAEYLGLDSQPDNIDNLLRLLNDLGAIMWFPDVDKDVVILHPQWLLDAMTCMIREHKGHHQTLLDDLLQDKQAFPLFEQDDIERGFFPVELMMYIWQSSEQKYNALGAKPNQIKAFIAILEYFGLIYRVRVPRKNCNTEWRECYGVPALMETLSPDECLDIDELTNLHGGDRCTCVLDFGVSKWLPSFMFERMLCNVMASEDVAGIKMTKSEVLFHIDKTTILLRLQADRWRIEAQTVNYESCGRASQRLLKLVESAMAKVIQGFNVNSTKLYRVLLETEKGMVDLSELRESTDVVRTVDQRWLISETTKALKDKWLDKRNVLSSTEIHSQPVSPTATPKAAPQLIPTVT